MAEFGPSEQSFDAGKPGGDGLRARVPDGFQVSDLAAFIERRLDRDRSQRLIEGLNADPALASWLLAARSDRDELTRFSEDGRRSSAGGVGGVAMGSLVAGAMARAEQEGVFAEAAAGAGEGDLFMDGVDMDMIDFAFDEQEPSLVGEAPAYASGVYSESGQSSASMWIGGLAAAAAVLVVGIGLGAWLGGDGPGNDDRVIAMGPMDEPEVRADRRPPPPARERRERLDSGRPVVAEQDADDLEAQRAESFEALASSVVDELASQQATQESAELNVFTDMPGLASSDSETTSPEGADGGQRAGSSGAGPSGRPSARREIQPAEAVRLAERGLLEIVVERDANDRRPLRIERHEALSADGVTIASLNGSDPTLVDAREAAIGRQELEKRSPSSEPFVYLVDLEPTVRRLDRLKTQLEQQTRGKVRFVEADRAIVPSVRAQIWLWTGERPDIRGRARFPLFVVMTGNGQP